MRSAQFARRRIASYATGSLSLTFAVLFSASCAGTSSSAGSAPAPTGASAMVSPVALPPMPTKTSTTDPRVGLRAGISNAGVAASNMTLVSHESKPALLDGEGGPRGLTFANSDLAFRGNYVYQGNFSGFQVWNVANPMAPVLVKTFVCGTGQGDPSVYGNLLFISSESTGDRTDCGTQGVPDKVSKDRMVGVRIFDVSDPANPKKVMDVQTCRGSHTHTLVPDPNDKTVVYVYVSGSAGVRSADELPGCMDGPIDSAGTSRFRVEVIRVPLAHPEQAKIVSYAHIFNDLAAATSHGAAPSDAPRNPPAAAAGGRGGAPGGGRGGVRTGPNQCHDITVYPSVGLAGGACGGYGLLLDIHDPINPKRLQAVGDSNFAFWHSATFSNDGSKVLFTDEWGGGTQPKCRADDPIDWGGDAIFTLKNDKLVQGAYFKMPAAQTKEENCVAHNGSLVPVPGRDIMVQGWYQGGLDVFDFTDAHHPYEIAYFDRGPIDSTKMITGGYWAGYWYNGHIYGSEIARGLDIFELTPNKYLSQNEIDAAKLVHWDLFNPQSQPKIVWPAAFPVVRSYLDQLVRNRGISTERASVISGNLRQAEGMSGKSRKDALMNIASELDRDATSSSDAAKVHVMAAATRELANAAQ